MDPVVNVVAVAVAPVDGEPSGVYGRDGDYDYVYDQVQVQVHVHDHVSDMRWGTYKMFAEGTMGRRPLSGVILVVVLGALAPDRLARAQDQDRVAPSPAAPRAIPPALQPWIPWVLKGTEVQRCPGSSGADDSASCAWSGPLRLELGPTGGRFVQTWEVFAETEVPLPGDRERWPFDVRAGGRPLAVQEVAMPALQVRLPPGKHQLTGSFLWPELPKRCRCPPRWGSCRCGWATGRCSAARPR